MEKQSRHTVIKFFAVMAASGSVFAALPVKAAEALKKWGLPYPWT